MLSPVFRRFAARAPSFGLASLSGIVLALAAAPFDAPALAFASAPLFLRALELAPANGRPLRAGLGIGFAAGLAAHVVAFYWAVPLFVVNIHAPTPLALVLAFLLWCLQCLPFALAGSLAMGLVRCGAAGWWAVPAAQAIAFSRAYMLFPWRPSSPVVEWLAWVQLADVGGGALLDVLLGVAGCATLEALRSRSRPLLVVGIAAVTLPLLYGVPRLRAVDAMRRGQRLTRIGLVQPNVPQRLKFDVALGRRQLFRLSQLTGQVERERPDFTIWPETSHPFRLRRDATQDPTDGTGVRTYGLFHGPLLFGALADGSGCDRRNSVVAMDRSGLFVGWADKAVPVPFAERIPFWEKLPVLRQVFRCPGYVTGQGAQILSFEGRRFGVLNCYEDILEGYVREVARAAPEFLVNVTNDAWFLDTTEPHLHHMAARMRAIEVRRDIVRSVNTGVSGHIAATGERVLETPTYVEATRVSEVRSGEGVTFYARHGDMLPWMLEGCLLAFLGAHLFRRARAT